MAPDDARVASGMSAETVAIIDYGSGNLHSALKAFERAAREAGLDGTRVVLDLRARHRRRAPTGSCCRGSAPMPIAGAAWTPCPGMVEAMKQVAHGAGRPFLGICVGMQLLATRGLEYAITPGLDWISGDVGPIHPADPALKIPHMGWNTIHARRVRMRCSPASRRGRAVCTPISSTDSP